jgi:hypothetical protein
MKYLNKLPEVSPVYIVSSEDDSMYQVIEYGEVLAHIVETIDGTRQTLYFPDGGEMHFQDTDLHQVMSHVEGKTNFQMAWAWLKENGYVVRADEGNGFLEVEVFNLDETDAIFVGLSEMEIEYRALKWRESRDVSSAFGRRKG